MPEVNEYLTNAIKYLSEKNYNNALEEYKKVLSEDNNNLEAIKGAGLCCFNLKQNKESIEFFERAISIDDNDATSLYYLASIYILQKDNEKALYYAKKVVELRPDYYDAYKILFSLYLKQQKFDELKNLFEEFEAKNIEPKDDSLHMIYATSYMLTKQYQEAVEILKKGLKYNPKPQTYNNLGVCYMSLKDYDAAINAFNKSLEIDNENPLTYADLGAVLQLKGDLLPALEAFNKALELEPTSFMHLLNVANLSNILKRYDLAINAYEKMLKINPELKDIQTSLIGAYVKNNQPDKAINLIDVALKKSPRNVPLLFRKAKIYTDIGEYTTAAKIYEQIINFKKNSSAVYHAYAMLFTKMDDYDNALKYFNKAVILDENNALIHKDLGVIYLMRHQIDYAKEEFDKAMELGAEDNNILKECADFYYSISDFQKADELYRKSLNLEKNPYTLLSFGINLIALNKLDEAFATLEPLMSVFPENAELLYNLARIFYAKEDYEKSARLSRKAYYQIPTIEIANLLALALKQIEDYKGAANIFDKIIEKYPMNEFIYDDLIECCEKLDDKELLIKTYKTANENLVYNESRIIKLSKALKENNQDNEAKKLLDKAYFEHPSEELKQELALYN